MAKARFDLNFKGFAPNAVVSALVKQAQAFFDACVAAGFETRGNGIDVRLDPEPEAKPAPVVAPPAARVAAKKPA